MVIRSPHHSDVFSALDRVYGLIDGSARWSDCLADLVRLADIKGCSLILYECGRSHSRMVETRGDGRQEFGVGHDIAIDDFLWRSSLGMVWSPLQEAGTKNSLVMDAMARRTGYAHAEAYAVIDRDLTHILYLAFSGHRPGRPLDREISALLDGLLPHLHRACRLLRSIQDQTLLQLVNPDRAASIDTAAVPIELRLRRRFKLSKAEARVAKLLAEGLAPRIIADRLHVSIHTVRSQLQAIFQKTDTCRQAELTSLLLRETEIPTALCRARPEAIESRERPSCL